MGCRESKLAVSTNEPVKKTKSDSSRSTSRKVDRLNSNSTSASTPKIFEDKEKVKSNKDVMKQDEPNKMVESKGCQTMDYSLKEGTAEEEENKYPNLKERNDEDIQIVVEDQNEDDQVQETKEQTKDGEPGEINVEVADKPIQEQKENGDAEFVIQQENEQIPSDKIEIVEEQEQNIEEVAKQEQNAKEEDEIIEKQVEEEEESITDPIKVDIETVVDEEADTIVPSNVDHQLQVIEQEGEPRKDEDDVATSIVDQTEDASNLNEEATIVEEEEVEPLKVEEESTTKEDSDAIMVENVDSEVSGNIDKTNLNEQEDGTILEEKITAES